MNRPFDVQMEIGYQRKVLFAVELVDSVTLERISKGIKVTADGLRGTPVVNNSGFFVWREEDFARLRRLRVEPGVLPYDPEEFAPADVTRPLKRIDLRPRASYPIPNGVTALRGTLVERIVPLPGRPDAVSDATVGLEWRDDEGNWKNAPMESRTDAATGDFAAILRLAPTEIPELDPAGAITVRLRFNRPARSRRSVERKLLPGRVAEPSALERLIFAWEDLQP